MNSDVTERHLTGVTRSIARSTFAQDTHSRTCPTDRRSKQ